jgi:hypothetical protein
MPEGFSLHLHGCGNLKSRIIMLSIYTVTIVKLESTVSYIILIFAETFKLCDSICQKNCLSKISY